MAQCLKFEIPTFWNLATVQTIFTPVLRLQIFEFWQKRNALTRVMCVWAQEKCARNLLYLQSLGSKIFKHLVTSAYRWYQSIGDVDLFFNELFDMVDSRKGSSILEQQIYVTKGSDFNFVVVFVGLCNRAVSISLRKQRRKNQVGIPVVRFGRWWLYNQRGATHYILGLGSVVMQAWTALEPWPLVKVALKTARIIHMRFNLQFYPL